MNQNDYALKRISILMNVGIFCIDTNGISSFQEHPEYNPLYRSEQLRNHLLSAAEKQEKPYLYRDSHMVYFASIKSGHKYFLIGPMSIELLNRVELHQYYRNYEMSEIIEKRLKHFAFAEVLDVVELLANLVTNKQYTDDELIYANHIVEESKAEVEQEKVVFDIKKGEEELYHHTYQEERKLLDSVREGRVDDAVRYSRNMDEELGKLSTKELNHWKNVAVVAITLGTRAAIEGGLSPSIAYRLSDFYIQKSDSCGDIAQVLEYRNHAIEELTSRVLKRQQSRSTSNYVEQCKDYVEKHYRQKIYQEDIADMLGISSSYLSKLFHKETGVRLQDFIVQTRVDHAANLLTFSNESIARIAEYVNFPSQSYFGRVFKEQKQMSPKKYRELNKPSEF